MRTSTTFAWTILISVAVLGQFALADVLVTKTGERLEGKVIETGEGYTLIKPDGEQLKFAKTEVRVEKAPGSSGSGKAPAAQPAPGPAAAAGDEKLIVRVVTGIGTDPDKAIQAAFSQAIESAVGVLVDAETIVKNDQIIKDKILTFSRGFVRSYDVVKQWEEKGLRYATIKALVETGKLTDSLTANNVLRARQIGFDFKNEAEAAEMLKKILDDFDMAKLTRVEKIGKPEVVRDGANAKMTIRARVSPDTGEWGKFSRGMGILLGKIATRRGAHTLKDKLFDFGNEGLAKQLKGEGVLVALFTSTTGNRTDWNVYRVPGLLEDPIKNAAQRTAYRVGFALLTKEGTEIARSTADLTYYDFVGSNPSRSIFGGHSYHLRSIWFVGPVWHRGEGGEIACPLYNVQTTFVLSQEDLARVATETVFLEEWKGRN